MNLHEYQGKSISLHKRRSPENLLLLVESLDLMIDELEWIKEIGDE